MVRPLSPKTSPYFRPSDRSGHFWTFPNHRGIFGNYQNIGVLLVISRKIRGIFGIIPISNENSSNCKKSWFNPTIFWLKILKQGYFQKNRGEIRLQKTVSFLKICNFGKSGLPKEMRLSRGSVQCIPIEQLKINELLCSLLATDNAVLDVGVLQHFDD